MSGSSGKNGNQKLQEKGDLQKKPLAVCHSHSQSIIDITQTLLGRQQCRGNDVNSGTVGRVPRLAFLQRLWHLILFNQYPSLGLSPLSPSPKHPADC